MGNEAEIEGGGVVVLHGKLVVCVIFVNQADLFNGIFCFIELLENFQHVLGDVIVDDHFSLVGFAIQPHMEHMQIP